MRRRFPFYALLVFGPIVAWLALYGDRAAPGALARGNDGVWLSRRVLHGGGEPLQALAARARAHGITRLYPFLGPPDTLGWPGAILGGTHRRVPMPVARAALATLRAADPALRLLPWTGGVLHDQITLRPGPQRRRWLGHLADLVAAGAHGVHINIEPLPSGAPGFLDLLAEARATLGPEATISVAAYPPESPGRPAGDTEWSLAYLEAVCRGADELVVMGYDTGHRWGLVYETLVAHWARALAETLPPPSEGGCTWSMGVPAYEDDVPWHRPDVETLGRALAGVQRGLADGAPEHFLGVTVYADWTVDAEEWATFDRVWRGGR